MNSSTQIRTTNENIFYSKEKVDSSSSIEQLMIN